MRAPGALLLACVAILLIANGGVFAQDSGTPQFAYGPPKGWVYQPDAETLEILKQKAMKEAAAAAAALPSVQGSAVSQPQPGAAGVVPLANQGTVAGSMGKRVAKRGSQAAYLQTRGSSSGGGRRLLM